LDFTYKKYYVFFVKNLSELKKTKNNIFNLDLPQKQSVFSLFLLEFKIKQQNSKK